MKKLVLLGFVMGFAVNAFSQIMSFEFVSLAGNEASGPSTSNDPNLASSALTRGSGLTASSNAQRFNATNWALTSIDNAVSGSKYMEFTITPNSGYQFSVSSIAINLQRSGTGPSAVALRSSLDGFAANLDQEYAITDVTTTQVFTFTFTQNNSTDPVTYRFYMFAEAGTGSGGIGDGTGDDLIVYGAVSSTGVVEPEPDSHVTGFSSVAENSYSVSLEFTGSTGTNLPSGYLIVGKTGAGEYATADDGSPVSNDSDWSDGTFALNVTHADGVIQKVIENLSSNTTFSFQVIPYSNSGLNIDFKVDGTIPEVTVSTTEVELPVYEEFTGSLGPWKSFSVAGSTDVWKANASDAGVNGFGDEDDEDWLILTPINFENYLGETISFKVRDRFTGAGGDLQLLTSTDYIEGTNPSTATWTSGGYTFVEGSTTSSYSAWSLSGDIDISSVSGSAVSIAFKYTGTAALSKEWNLDSIVVKASGTVPVELSSFTVSASGKSALLKWETTTEKSNAGFEVLKSSDKKTWNSMAFINGKGTTTEKQVYSYSDKNVTGTVYYRLKQVDTDGTATLSEILSFNGIPAAFEVSGNYPNPFNPATTIRFTLPVASPVVVKVHNIIGQQIATLVNGKLEAGLQEIPFDASGLASGVYFYSVSANGKTITKSMTLMK